MANDDERYYCISDRTADLLTCCRAYADKMVKGLNRVEVAALVATLYSRIQFEILAAYQREHKDESL